ncbi:MAG: caspase family protein [Helicobacteraceae bacterium]|jgi:uncharacterized protein YjiK|nr:caspase family protein [Helicobacteraceae bacterium]
MARVIKTFLWIGCAVLLLGCVGVRPLGIAGQTNQNASPAVKRIDPNKPAQNKVVWESQRYGVYSPSAIAITTSASQTFTGHSSLVNSVAFSADNRYVLSGSDDNTVRLWDIKTGKEIRRFTGHSSSVYSVAFSADGKYALSGSGDKTVRLWDIKTGKEIRRFTGHSSSVYSVAFSFDSRYALSGSADKTVRLWDIKTGKEIRRFTGHSDWVSSVAFSADGKYALSGSYDETVRLWDTQTGKEIRRFAGQGDGRIYSVAFSFDGKYALSGSGDKTVRLWDIQTGREIRRFTGHSSLVNSVAFSSDSKYALSGSDDQTVRLWDIQTGDKMALIARNVQDRLKAGYAVFTDIPPPSLPEAPVLTKSQFETKAEFQARIDKAAAEREKQIEHVQERYRKAVEARNLERQTYIQTLPQRREALLSEEMAKEFGAPALRDFVYDAERQIAYATIYAVRGGFEQRIEFAIAPKDAQDMFNRLNQVEARVTFAIKNDVMELSDIRLPYGFFSEAVASVSKGDFKNEPIKVALKDEKINFDAPVLQNPNLIDRFAVKALRFQGNEQDDLAPLIAKAKQAPIDSKKWLFVVAVEHYDETDDVIYAKNSAEAFVKAAQKRLGIDDRHTYSFIDDRATASVFDDHLKRFLANVQKGDSIYFYYSGHGIPNPSGGEAYFLPKDKVVDYVTKERNLMATEVYNRLSNSGAKQVIAFVDSCFSGRTDNISNFKGVAAGLFKTKRPEFDRSKMVVITAGTSAQFSSAHPEKPHRLFTYYLTRSLLENDKIDLDLLYKKTASEVKKVSWQKGDIYLQEPTIEGNNKLEL